MTRALRRLAPLAFILLTACSTAGTTPNTPASTRSHAAPTVYAAIGASEGVGAGAANPISDAWPQVFFRTALSESTVMYNFSIPGATVATALSQELPDALSVQPTLVTVWLNVNDLIAGVGTSDYEQELDRLVHALRRGGAAEVLLANTPYLDRLPIYLSCRAGQPIPGSRCIPALSAITPQQINAAVDAYNSAIAGVAKRENAVLVDLHAQGEVPDVHPNWVSEDGFHPSTIGYAAIAATFAAALKQVD